MGVCFVLPRVADGHLALCRHIGTAIEEILIPPLHNHPQAVAKQLTTRCDGALRGNECGEVVGDRFLKDDLDKQADITQVGEVMLLQVVGGELDTLAQAHTGLIDLIPLLKVGMVLFQQIVGLGKSAAQVDVHHRGALLDAFDKSTAERMVHRDIVGL